MIGILTGYQQQGLHPLLIIIVYFYVRKQSDYPSH